MQKIRSHIPLSPHKKYNVRYSPKLSKDFLASTISCYLSTLTPLMKIALLELFTFSSTPFWHNFSTNLLYHSTVTLWGSEKVTGGKVFLPALENIDHLGLHRTEMNSLHCTYKYKTTKTPFILVLCSPYHPQPLTHTRSLSLRSFPTNSLLCAYLLALPVILHKQWSLVVGDH